MVLLVSIHAVLVSLVLRLGLAFSVWGTGSEQKLPVVRLRY